MHQFDIISLLRPKALMLNWFKKDPLLHVFFVLLTIPGIVLVLIIGFLIYGIFELFNPNYEEFGPKILLYKAQNCAEIDKPDNYWNSNQCYITIYHEGMWRNNPDPLSKIVEHAATQPEIKNHPTLWEMISLLTSPKRLPALEGYPQKGAQWVCSKNSQIIADITTEPALQAYYKCWPK